jgi:hypothetical protein
MLRIRIRIAVILFLLAGINAGICNAQYFSNFNPNDDLFKYRVKLIDEFIERFNDEPTSYLRKSYLKDKKKYDIPRSMLLVSLFDLQNTTFTKDTSLNDFFRKILNREHPVYLSFEDSSWYAEAKGIFLYDGKLLQIPMELHVVTLVDGASKWMIAGLGNYVPYPGPAPSVSVITRKDQVTTPYIPTSAYATDFVELHQIFSDKMMPDSFFEPSLLGSEHGQQFVDQVRSGRLKFRCVKSITFHFFQVPGWIFTVDQFSRKSNNSGWLISSVKKTNQLQKQLELRKLLNRE